MSVTPKGEATQTVIRYWKRFIGSAIQEQASIETIEHYLKEQGVVHGEKYRIEVMSKPMVRLLTGAEMMHLGGRNKLRALLGLDPVEVKPEVTFDFPLSESGDAELFAQMHGDELRYDHLRGRWLVSDEMSGLWLPDKTEHIFALALETMRERQKRAVVLEDYAQRKQMLDWAMHGESRSRLTNMLELSKKKEPISDDGEQWDKDPWLLGCRNGIVNLKDGSFRTATPADRVTMRIKIAFDPKAECPLWEASLGQIFEGHDVPSEPSDSLLDQPVEPDHTQSVLIVAFMQRALGYSITGDCSEECCFFCWGDGRNGKGTIFQTLGDEILGDYKDEMQASAIEKAYYKGSAGNASSDMAKIDGKRFISCSEVNEFHINESRLKALTGRDPITARFLYSNPFTFTPVGKIWIATNTKPKITGVDDGIWSRIHLIPFTQKFEGKRRDKTLKDRLRMYELPGILNWLIKGCIAWQSEGLNPPAVVKVATEDYRKESEPVTPFIAECCVVQEGTRVQAMALWLAYKRWIEGQHEGQALTDKAFHKCMKRHYASESGRQTFYLGLGLLDGRQGESNGPGF